jgi:hypothetical protein
VPPPVAVARAKLQLELRRALVAPVALVVVPLLGLVLALEPVAVAELRVCRSQLQALAVLVVPVEALPHSRLGSSPRTFRPKGKNTCASSSSFRTRRRCG